MTSTGTGRYTPPVDQALHDRILGFLPLAQSAANRFHQAHLREDIYQACCLRIVEVCSSWTGPEDQLERRLRNSLKDASWSELGLCLRPFGHLSDKKGVERLLAVTPTSLDFTLIPEDQEEEYLGDVRDVVHTLIAEYPEEERAMWLDLLLDHGIGVGTYEGFVAKHGLTSRWLRHHIWGVKARLRMALARAGLAA